MNGKEMLEMLLQRQSDRAYEVGKEVEKEKLNRILEAGRMAPSACNAQPWKFIVVDEAELKNKVADATSAKLLGMNHFTKQAPIHIAIVREKPNITAALGGWIKDKDFSHMDIGIAAQSMCLQAAAEGLGTCMLGWFDEKKVKELLHIPKNKRVELILTLGYPAKETRQKVRKPLEEVVSRNRY